AVFQIQRWKWSLNRGGYHNDRQTDVVGRGDVHDRIGRVGSKSVLRGRRGGGGLYRGLRPRQRSRRTLAATHSRDRRLLLLPLPPLPQHRTVRERRRAYQAVAATPGPDAPVD